MRTVEWSIFKPTLASGRVLSQLPDPEGHESMRRARSTWSIEFWLVPFNRRRPKISEPLWTDGAGLDACLIHVERAMAVPMSSTSQKQAGGRLDVSSAVLAAKAK